MLFYVLARCLVRVSISLFYLRIFRVPGARQLIILSLVLNGAITITYATALIFQCTPINFFWLQWDGLHEGHCIDQWAMLLSGGCVTIALDIFICLLPMPWVFQLQFSREKKLLTVAMFALGLV